MTTDTPHKKHPCWCEDSSHAPDKWCHNSAEGGAVADFVGNVCRECARTHYRSFIIWPTQPNGDIYTITGRDTLAHILDIVPDAPFMEIGLAYDGAPQYRVALTPAEYTATKED